ncbi:hypothetical protein [Apibacter adventoris]|uniref:hypothetical protein n=1 Tax=Apibacter adventoris TaxID=1679466 RepID=UPI0015E38D23|nr:hypothetical protein [Apibacter adventoris]
MYKVYQIIADKISVDQDCFFESQNLLKIDYVMIDDDHNIDAETFYLGELF